MPLITMGRDRLQNYQDQTFVDVDPISGETELTGDTILWDEDAPGADPNWRDTSGWGRVQLTGETKFRIPVEGKVKESIITEPPEVNIDFPDLDDQEHESVVDEILGGGDELSPYDEFLADWDRRWMQIPVDVRNQVSAMFPGAATASDAFWAGVEDLIGQLNAAYITNNRALADTLLGTIRDTLAAAGGGAAKGGGTSITTAPVDEPVVTEEVGQPAVGDARAPLDLGFLDQIGSLSTIFYAEGGSLANGVIGEEFTNWYEGSSVSPAAASLAATNLFRQVQEAWQAGDTDKLRGLMKALSGVSPTMASAIESYIGGPGEDFSDAFHYRAHEYAVDPESGSVRVWDPVRHMWVSYTENLASPDVIDYYLENIFEGTKEEGPVEGYIEGVGLPNESGVYSFSIPFGRGQAQMRDPAIRAGAKPPSFTWNKNTGKLDYVDGYTGQGSFRANIMQMMMASGWKIKSRSGDFEDWTWAPPSEPYAKGEIVVEGPPTEERAGSKLTGRTAA